MEEIAERKECGAETGAGKIEVVTDAMFLAPAHGGEPLKSLGNMGAGKQRGRERPIDLLDPRDRPKRPMPKQNARRAHSRAAGR